MQKLDGKIPLFVDTKKRELGYLKEAWVKVNELEYSQLAGKPVRLVVTLGNRGSRSEGHAAPAQHIDVVDPCGAGDTYLSAFAWFMMQTSDVRASMVFANSAAAVTCNHRGTYAPTLEEMYR